MIQKKTYKSGEHALTLKQVKVLLHSFDRISDKAVISLAISTGMRREDIAKIKRADYNPPEITYYESKKARTRTITIPSQECIQSINMHLNSCRSSKWLFPSSYGKTDNHISGRQLYNILNKTLTKLKINNRPFHSLRATCYKLCESAGWGPRKAAALLGDTLQVAEEHYNAPSTEEMRELAIEKPII